MLNRLNRYWIFELSIETYWKQSLELQKPGTILNPAFNRKLSVKFLKDFLTRRNDMPRLACSSHVSYFGSLFLKTMVAYFRMISETAKRFCEILWVWCMQGTKKQVSGKLPKIFVRFCQLCEWRCSWIQTVAPWSILAGGGESFGNMTAEYLNRLESENGVMLAVCTSDYGEKTDSTYCTYYELQYAKEYNLDVLPLQVEDQWKPNPPCHPDRDPKKSALGFIKMVFLNGIVRVDCRNKSIEEIASAIAAVLKRKPEAWIDKAARGMREETGSVESEATPSCGWQYVFGWILPMHKASSFYSCSANGWWCPFKNIAPSPKVRLYKQRSSLAKSHLGTSFCFSEPSEKLLPSWDQQNIVITYKKKKLLRLFFVVISNIQRDWFALNDYCIGRESTILGYQLVGWDGKNMKQHVLRPGILWDSPWRKSKCFKIPPFEEQMCFFKIPVVLGLTAATSRTRKLQCSANQCRIPDSGMGAWR